MVWGSNGLKSCDALLQRIDRNDPSLTSIIVLPMKTFGSTEVERLAEILLQNKNSHLTSISASGHHDISISALEILSKALNSQGGRMIRHLSIGDDTMGDEGIQALFSHGTTYLQEIDLGSKGLTPIGCSIIGKILALSNHLQRLELYRNPKIGNEGLVSLCSSATPTPTPTNSATTESSCFNTIIPFAKLHFLDISECNVGLDGIDALAKCLLPPFLQENNNNDPHRQLELVASINPLSPQAGIPLSKLIAGNQLSRLLLKSCQLGDDGVRNLIQGCIACTQPGTAKLECLDLSQNGITDEGAITLANALQSNQQTNLSRLKELKLAGNGDIGSKGTVALAQALQESNTVRILDMAATDCGVDGACALMGCPSLRSLCLFENNLGSTGFEALTVKLQGGHPTLEHIDLGGNRADEPAVVGLLNAVMIKHEPDTSSLRTLELGGNEGGDKVETLLFEMKRLRPDLDVARDKPKSRNNQLSAASNNELFQNMQTSWIQH